jgi:outer membrane protein
MTKPLLFALAAMAVLGLPLSAQNTGIGVVDLRKVFDNYWKTRQADTALKAEAASLDGERKSMVDQFQKEQENYRQLLVGTNDSALSIPERDRRRQSAEEHLLKLKELQGNLEQFDRQARVSLGEKQRRMRDNILAEIKEAIKAKARASGCRLVVDSAAESANNTPVLPYTDGQNDLTDEVLNHLNLHVPAALEATTQKTGKR